MSQTEWNIGTWKRKDNFLQHVVLEDVECRFARLAARTYDSGCDGKPWYKRFYQSIYKRSGLDLAASDWELIKLEGPAFGERHGER